VYVTAQDIQNMSRQLGMTTIDFIHDYTYRVGQRRVLTSHPNQDCIFLKGSLCLVHDTKPAQCRAFPYWPEIIQNEEAFDEAQEYCEGLQKMTYESLLASRPGNPD
jgi:Fe-S-cluster containining protein